MHVNDFFYNRIHYKFVLLKMSFTATFSCCHLRRWSCTKPFFFLPYVNSLLHLCPLNQTKPDRMSLTVGYCRSEVPASCLPENKQSNCVSNDKPIQITGDRMQPRAQRHCSFRKHIQIHKGAAK